MVIVFYRLLLLLRLNASLFPSRSLKLGAFDIHLHQANSRGHRRVDPADATAHPGCNVWVVGVFLTGQVRVVGFYVSCLAALLLVLLNRKWRRAVFPVPDLNRSVGRHCLELKRPCWMESTGEVPSMQWPFTSLGCVPWLSAQQNMTSILQAFGHLCVE